MEDVAPREDRDRETGRFLPGNSGFAGRPIGSRNRLTTEFLNDLREAWQKHGRAALEKCAAEDPAAFVRVVSGLLPRHAEIDVNLDMYANVDSVVEMYRMMSAAVGGDTERVIRGLRKHVPHLLLDHE
jgi:hypothetical protein